MTTGRKIFDVHELPHTDARLVVFVHRPAGELVTTVLTTASILTLILLNGESLPQESSVSKDSGLGRIGQGITLCDLDQIVVHVGSKAPSPVLDIMGSSCQIMSQEVSESFGDLLLGSCTK